MKTFTQFNESLRDKMKPKSEEDLKKSLGEEKFSQYKKLLELEAKLKPISTTVLNLDYFHLKFYTECVDFIIKFENNKYIVLIEPTKEVNLFNTLKEIFNYIKITVINNYQLSILDKDKEIKELEEEKIYLKEEIEKFETIFNNF
jgi:predicted patatin/cPLA2 family phospholipase